MPEDDKVSEAILPNTSVVEDIVPDAEVVEERIKAKAQDRPSAPVATKRSSSFFPVFLGGIIAAAAGFGAAQLVPQGWPLGNTDSLQQALAAQEGEITSLKAALGELSAKPSPDVAAEISALRAEVDQKLTALSTAPDPSADIAAMRQTVDDALAGFDARLTQVEKAPAGAAGGASATAVAAYERDLQALRAQVQQIASSGGATTDEIQQAVASAKAELAAAAQEAEKLKADAAAAARTARLNAAMGRIDAALEAGGPFSSAVSDLTEEGIEVPPAISSVAATGVLTLTELQRAFPAASRAALDAALRSDVGQGWGDRLATFLRTQTGARSLEPRAGTDPDAILSRAEAALQAGDLSATLAEIAALPDAAKAAMADWVAAAELRQQTASAAGTLAAAVDTQ